jgi:signal transduction histidine kinase
LKKLAYLYIVLFGLLVACQSKDTLAPPIIKDPIYLRAKSFMYKKPDSAFYYFSLVATAVPDSLQAALAYNYMGRIQSEAGDYFGSQESLIASLRYLDTTNEKHRQCLASDYNELGLTSVRLEHFDAAISYFDRVGSFRDPNDSLILLNNKGLAYQSKGDYRQALAIYDGILQRSPQPKTFARILTNRATARSLANPAYPANAELLRALAIRLREKDKWGQNSSYAHLADFYRSRRPDSALFYARKMYTVAREIESPDDESQALEKLIVLDEPVASKRYFNRYQVLNDSLQTARNAAKNQFALIRYEVEKNKADNLALQKANTEKKYQLLVVLIAGLIGLIITVLWYRRFRRQKAVEKEAAIQETQRKAAKKVHDTLANDIYRIMKKIQHDTGVDKEWLLDNIDDVYKRSRDISYDIIQNADDRFHEKLTELLSSFATETTRIVLAGNDAELWQKVNPAYKFELKYVLQELMVNMQKHSKATNVVIRFEEQENHIQITYIDNGIGFDPNTVQKNGLQNTGNRINGIGGQITFESGTGEGLSIQLVFPAV